MAQTSNHRRNEQMMADLLGGQMGLQAFAAKYQLSLKDLAQWFTENDVYQSLTALRALADFQTQLVLSQHRVTAAAALMNLAAGDAPAPETKRKACVDVLRLNMPRIDPREHATQQNASDDPALAALHKALLAEEAANPDD